MADDRGDETHTKINATIQTRFGRKTVRYLLAVIIGGGILGSSVGILHNPIESCQHYENELAQWREWAKDRSRDYPKTGRAEFWSGVPITLDVWRAE